MNGKTKAIEKRESSELVNIPDYLRHKNGEPQAGLENIESRDMTIPRLALCQSGTPQRKRSDPKFIEGLDEGFFFNSVTGDIYGPSVKVVPLMFFKTRLLFKSFDDGGGILCQAPDNKLGIGEPGGECDSCPLANFTDNKAPACTQFYNYAVLVVPKKGKITPSCLAVFSLKSTGLKIAREWNARMRLRGTDSFAGIYELKSAEDSNKIGQWFTPTVQSEVAWATEEQYRTAQECYKGVRELQLAGKLKIDADEMREPGAEG